jgi:hypothetical protein
MKMSRIENELFTARMALQERAEAARLRADLLGEASNDFDVSLDGRELADGELSRVERLCEVSNRASELADRLEDRVNWLKVAEDALESAGDFWRTARARKQARKERGARKRQAREVLARG